MSATTENTETHPLPDDEEGRGWINLRNVSLGFLSLITIAVAIFSAKVSYDILSVPFGHWAYLIVGSLDSVWILLVAAEYAAGNNRKRALPVQVAGLVITGIVAAIPTVELIIGKMNSGDVGVEVALTPIAILVTKVSWVFLLASFGRHVSPETRAEIAQRRQEVRDQLEKMEAEAAHEVEALKALSAQKKRIAEAQAEYRKALLEAQEEELKTLHAAGVAFDGTREKMPMPEAALEITIPTLDDLLSGHRTLVTQQAPTRPALTTGRSEAPAEDAPATPAPVPLQAVPPLSTIPASPRRRGATLSISGDGLSEAERDRKLLAALLYQEEDRAKKEGRAPLSQAELGRRQGASPTKVSNAKKEWPRHRFAGEDFEEIIAAS